MYRSIDGVTVGCQTYHQEDVTFTFFWVTIKYLVW